MSSLLIAEHTLQVLPTLACRIGLHEAIVLQQIHYLSLRPSNRDGWVCKSLDEWCDVFAFLSRRSIERVFAKLREQRLLMAETVPGGGRRSRVRIDHDVLDALTALRDESDVWPGKPNRQIGGTNPPIWRDQSAKLAGPNRQIGGTSVTRLKEETAEGTTERENARTVDEQIEVVFEAWQSATGKTDAVLDDNRRRLIAKRLKSHGLTDCVDAVKGWRHSPYYCGRNADKAPRNSLTVLLGTAERLEECRDLERHRGSSDKLPAGNVAAARCPGAQPAAASAWAPIAQRLQAAVPPSTHGIWLKDLHPHAELDGALVIGVPAAVATWVGERFRSVLDAAAEGVQITLVECDGLAA